MPETRHVQANQPAGVPPLELTGERTLPDVPAENYWFQRHLVVYEWVRARVGGLRVIDTACGEGYGSAVLARTASSVIGVEANPEAYEHARLRYRLPNVRFERALVEEFEELCDAIVCLQTIEHLREPEPVLDHFARMLSRGGTVYISTPNVLTLAPDGVSTDNPWHVREYRPEEFEQLLSEHFAEVELLGLFHDRKLAAHEFALDRLSWDAVHERLGITKPFYDRFLPAIDTEDFKLSRLDASFLGKSLDVIAVCRR